VSGIFNDERPGGLILAAGQSPRENEAVLPLALRDQEPAGSSGECGEYASHADVLMIGQDAFGAKLTAVRDEVVGIPSGMARTHLGQPRPDVVRRATNRDGVIDRAQGLRNQVVPGKNPGLLVRSYADLPGRWIRILWSPTFCRRFSEYFPITRV
jgi:hypothetical protein